MRSDGFSRLVAVCLVQCTHFLFDSIYTCYSQEKKQHGGGGGKGKWNDLDDGTLDALHTSDVVGETVPDDAL